MEISFWRRVGCLIILALLLLSCGCTPDDGGDQALLFEDDFEDPLSGWGEDQRDEFERGYERGEYFFELSKPDWFIWAYPGKTFDDVNVEADAYLASGSQESHFGLICRHEDWKNFYYFAISADGYYAIFRRQDGADLEVLTAGGSGMTFSPAIRTGEQTNRIVAVCQEDELSLYVNGQLLETVTDDAHRRGDVGIGAGSGSGEDVGLRVQFDNFIVTRP